jgi:1,4-dihydroxy-2-naphthoate polyprenyltransferase
MPADAIRARFPLLAAARPATLPAAAAPVLVGTACAYAAGGSRAGPALAAFAGAVLIQVGTNFANDVFDHEKGADRADRLGPTRAVQAGLVTPAAMRRATAFAFALAAACGLYLTWVAGWPVVAIGVASLLAGLGYTAGPYPLGYHGLGDLFVLLFFGGVAVCGAAFVQAGSIPEAAYFAALPVGALATAILVVNNVRDRDGDARAGKRTLVVRFGRRFGVAEYLLLLGAAYAVPPVMVAAGAAGAWALLPLGTAPLAVARARAVAAKDGAALNPELGATARLLLLYSALFALGLAL